MITLLEKTVDVACASNGYFLRWYFNGWHHWLFKAGEESFVTSGTVCNTYSISKVTIGDGCLTENQIRGIRTMLFASDIQVLMQDGWKAVIVDSSTLPIFHTKSPSYNCEFTISIYAKVADYSPIVPVAPAEDLIVAVQLFADIELEQNATLTLPATALCTYASGSTANLPVVWGEANTLTIRTFTVVGKIAGSVVDASVKVIVTPIYSDLDILRMIRDANPASQLPSLWLDSEDPYTQWEGVQYSSGKLIQLNINNLNITNLPNIGKLNYIETINANYNPITSIDLVNCNTIINFNCSSGNSMRYLNIDNCPNIKQITCNYQVLATVNLLNIPLLETILLSVNQLISIPTLTSKGNIINYDFRNNNFPTTELDRFRAMGFTDESKLLPQNP